MAMPKTLTKIFADSVPEPGIKAKRQARERNTPRKNTESAVWPQVMRGWKIGHFRPRQSFGRNRAARNTTTTRCKTRYGARLTLSLGLKASTSHLGKMVQNWGKPRAL